MVVERPCWIVELPIHTVGTHGLIDDELEGSPSPWRRSSLRVALAAATGMAATSDPNVQPKPFSSGRASWPLFVCVTMRATGPPRDTSATRLTRHLDGTSGRRRSIAPNVALTLVHVNRETRELGAPPWCGRARPRTSRSVRSLRGTPRRDPAVGRPQPHLTSFLMRRMATAALRRGFSGPADRQADVARPEHPPTADRESCDHAR